jgi:hypothetical protein
MSPSALATAPAASSAQVFTISPARKVLTFGRVAPVVVSFAVAITSVAVNPGALGSAIAASVQACMMAVIVKTWILR